jgi:Tol biopolymer transport system component
MPTNPSRWERANDIFHRAIAVPDGERRAFIAEECRSDADLRAEVMSLVEAHRASTIMTGPIIAGGTRIGVYEIIGFIDAGGMGEVYRARDPRLGRDVAIKVLPAAFSADAERLRRFEQEARAAAALNHPNILVVFDIGQYDGAPYIVSELLEGGTLRERLNGGALPVRRAVEHGVQICHGLAAAHEKGIVHRDLKPENIFVTSDGRVKILDFGLAKLTVHEPPAGSVSALPTTPLHTTVGVVLGTLGYMAPEQVRGLDVDHRADFFAFGAVLYEMLSGRRAFAGETPMDVMSAILKEGAHGLPAEVRHAAPSLEAIVDRCLEKNPAARFKTADDLAFALNTLSLHSLPESSSPDIVPRRLMTHRVAWWAAAAVLIIAVATGGWAYLRRTPPAAPAYWAMLPLPAGTNMSVVDLLAPRRLALSPDGRRLAFVTASADGRRQLWVRPLDGLAAQPLVGTENAFTPFWSPDSQWIGFYADGKLKKISASGGPPLTLCDWRGPGGGATWNRDGVILFGDDVGPFTLRRVSASGGTASAVRTPSRENGETEFAWPYFLPDGRTYLYRVRGANPGVYLGSLDSDLRKRLVASDSNAKYAQGHLLFMRQTTLMAQPFDVSRLELGGDAVPIAERVSIAGMETGAFTVSDNGVLVYETGAAANMSHLEWIDRAGKTIGTLGDAAFAVGDVELSPDDKRAAVSMLSGTNRDIWIYDIARAVRTRFTFDPAAELVPIWSPDGARILFASNRTGNFDLYQKTTGGTGAEEPLLVRPEPQVSYSWSPDGRFVLFETRGRPGGSGTDIWVLALSGNREPVPFIQTPFDESRARVSPDGRWVTYTSDESGTPEVYVAPFPKADGKWQVSIGGGEWSRWRHDGKEIFYVAPNGRLLAAKVSAGSTGFTVGEVTPLFQTRARLIQGYPYDSLDGQRFLVNTTSEQEVSEPLTIVVNWLAALKK